MNILIKLAPIATIVFFATVTSWPSTELCGVKYSPFSLTKSSSPYLLTSDLVIPAGSRLTIEPGVEIIVVKDTLSKCKDTIVQRDWADSQFVSIKVDGALYVHGTETQLVRIHPSQEGKGVQWDGIRLKEQTPTSVEIRFLDIQGAHKALQIKESHFIVENSFFTNNNTALWLSEKANIQVRNSLFAQNQSAAVYLEHCAPVFEANLFVNNFTYAFWADSRKGVEISHNLFWNSGESHCYHCAAGLLKKTGINSRGDSVDASGNIIADPIFVGSASESWHIKRDPKIPTPKAQTKDTTISQMHSDAKAKHGLGVGKNYSVGTSMAYWKLSRYSPARDAAPDQSDYKDADDSRGDLGPWGGINRFIENEDENGEGKASGKAKASGH